MTPNLRDNSYDFALSVHFNTFRHGTLSPNLAYTAFTDGSEKVVKFLYARGYAGTTLGYWTYGLGANASGHPAIFRMLGYNNVWTAIDTAIGSLARQTGVFFEYKDCLYGWQGTAPVGTNKNADGEIWTVPDLETDTTPNLAQFQAINFNSVAQPVHHKADDYAYFFVDNLVYRHTGATDSTVWSLVLTLPTNMKIIGGAAYGNYLAIICSPKEIGSTNSVMYLWDRDSSLATLTAKIDLGMGEAIHVSEAEDGGVWITQKGTGIIGADSRNNLITVKYYNGFLETIEIPFRMPVDYFLTITLTGNAWEERNVFYFPATIITTGAAETRNVIFAARRNNGRIELVCDQEITGVTNSINGIFSIGGLWFVSYDTAAQCLIAKVSSGFQTGTYESKIFDGGDASLKKKLIGVTVMTSPLPSAGTTALYYRKDAETAWTLIFTHTFTTAGAFEIGKVYKILTLGTTDFTLIGASANTVDVVFTATGVGTGTGTAIDDLNSHSAINIESSGANLPEYKEIAFKILSTGGAEITGLSFKEEVLEKRIY